MSWPPGGRVFSSAGIGWYTLFYASTFSSRYSTLLSSTCSSILTPPPWLRVHLSSSTEMLQSADPANSHFRTEFYVKGWRGSRAGSSSLTAGFGFLSKLRPAFRGRTMAENVATCVYTQPVTRSLSEMIFEGDIGYEKPITTMIVLL